MPDVISLESVSSVACATGVEPFPSVSAGAETGEAPFAAVVLELPQSVGENPTQVTDGSEHKDDKTEPDPCLLAAKPEPIRPPEMDGKWRRRRPNRRRNRGRRGQPEDGETSEVGVA